MKRPTGEWLAFVDADDLWTPHKLQKQVTVFRENPMVDLVWGHVVEFSDANSELKTAGIAIPGHHPGTMLIRRSAFIEVGEFSEKYLLAEVVEWMARAKQIGINQVMLSDIFMYRRIHQTNKGKLIGNSKYEYLHILKKHRDHERTNK